MTRIQDITDADIRAMNGLDLQAFVEAVRATMDQHDARDERQARTKAVLKSRLQAAQAEMRRRMGN